MAFLGLMWVREHQMLMAVMKADMDEQRTLFRKEAYDDREMIARLGSQKVKHLTAIAGLQREVDGLRADVRQAEAAHDKVSAELATLKAERERRLAPLAAANAARKAKAQAARGGDVREGV